MLEMPLAGSRSSLLGVVLVLAQVGRGAPSQGGRTRHAHAKPGAADAAPRRCILWNPAAGARGAGLTRTHNRADPAAQGNERVHTASAKRAAPQSCTRPVHRALTLRGGVARGILGPEYSLQDSAESESADGGFEAEPGAAAIDDPTPHARRFFELGQKWFAASRRLTTGKESWQHMSSCSPPPGL